MSSTNKKGAGLILSLLTAVAGAVGLGFCIVNAGTDSFRKIGTSPIVIGCAVIAILALVLRVVLDNKLALAADAMSVVAGITLVVAAVQFISPRVNTIASIMTFTNNAQTMADLSSAIYGHGRAADCRGAEHHCRVHQCEQAVILRHSRVTSS